jgi:hypothetical protein
VRCQILGCKNKSTQKNVREGIFFGVYLENVVLHSCAEHSEGEILSAANKIAEGEVQILQQECNPFVDVKNLVRETA